MKAEPQVITAIESNIVFHFLQPSGFTDGTANFLAIIGVAMFFVLYGMPNFHIIRMHFIINKHRAAYCYFFG
jgi:hypothetical protein